MEGIVNKNPVNDAGVVAPRNHSNFNMSYSLAGTMRFGHIQPHFVMEGVADDHITLRSLHELRSYTMKNPILQDVKINKDYFMVPMEAILPKNWEKIFTNPVQGDDVNASEVNTVIPAYNSVLDTLVGYLVQNSPVNIFGSNFRDILCRLCLLEMFFSSGSLLNILGAKLSPQFRSLPPYNTSTSDYSSPASLGFDDLFDNYIHWLGTVFSSFSFYYNSDPSNIYIVYFDPSQISKVDSNAISFVEFLERFRDDPDMEFSNFKKPDGSSYSSNADYPTVRYNFEFNYGSSTGSLNVARCLAYQIVCAHYFTNDKIDYIYDAELYRQNVADILNQMFYVTGAPLSGYAPSRVFTMNGMSFEYDYLSGHYLTSVLGNGARITGISNWSKMKFVYGYLRLIFGINRSLRFVDYFVGSKANPLAVGDINIQVNQNLVSAIDVTRNIQRQRFFNAVNRAGRRFSEYLKEIFGVDKVSPDYHNPFFLAHTSDSIYTDETDNTASEQVNDPMSTTSQFRSTSERYAFETSLDRPCILIGVTTFDVSRFYQKSIDRHFFHEDRFDMFNPFMQTIGDQVVYRDELDSRAPHSAFGYQLRHMEYKQRVSESFGGFNVPSTDLDNWIFAADYDIPSQAIQHIGPDYIRSRPSEFDRFYILLTGRSLGTYFHFVMLIRNEVDANRPMIYAPTIL